MVAPTCGVALGLCGVLGLHPPYKTCSASSAYLTSALHSWTGPLTPSCPGGHRPEHLSAPNLALSMGGFGNLGFARVIPCVFHFRVAPQMPHPPVVTRIIHSHSSGDPELGAPHCKLVPSCWTVVLDRVGWQPVGMGTRRDIWEWGSPYTGTLK